MAKKISAVCRKRLFLTIAMVIAAGSETASAKNATSIYAQKCAECHGVSGKGDGPAGQIMVPPPMPFSTKLKGKSDSWIASVITQGGPAVGLSPGMPPHPNMSGSEVRDLTQYIKGLNS
jgi:mono/diheme cytochrome c family protein